MNHLLFILLFFSSFFNDEDKYYSDIINTAVQKQKEYRPGKKDYVIVIDYRKNIFSERLFLVEMKSKSIILKSTVSHAFNSGIFTPSDYSNSINTNKSCYGAFLTESINHSSKFGISLIIRGLDKGINDNAKSREIIFHSDEKMKTKWSKGCFATPNEVNNKIVQMTKGGCLVWVIK